MATKDNIISKALSLFLKKGYRDVSLNEIAETVGITKGGIYHYYNSKDQLLFEVINLFFDETEKWIFSFSKKEKSFKDNLRDLFLSIPDFVEYINVMAEDTEDAEIGYYYFLFDAVKVYPEIKKRYDLSLDRIDEWIKNGLVEIKDKGEVSRNLDCKSLSIELFAMVEGLLILNVLSNSIDLKKDCERVFNLIWNGIKP